MIKKFLCLVKHDYEKFSTFSSKPGGVVSKTYKKCSRCEKTIKKAEIVLPNKGKGLINHINKKLVNYQKRLNKYE